MPNMLERRELICKAADELNKKDSPVESLEDDVARYLVLASIHYEENTVTCYKLAAEAVREAIEKRKKDLRVEEDYKLAASRYYAEAARLNELYTFTYPDNYDDQSRVHYLLETLIGAASAYRGLNPIGNPMIHKADNLILQVDYIKRKEHELREKAYRCHLIFSDMSMEEDRRTRAKNAYKTALNIIQNDDWEMRQLVMWGPPKESD